MSDFKSGMLVQHASLGLGKVVAVDCDAVHVFFEAGEKRVATKLRLSIAGPLLQPATTQNAWLKGMASFSLDEKTGRYGLAGTWISQEEAIARFTELFPGGFADPKYLGSSKKWDRAARWRAAHQEFVDLLGDGQGERLLEKRKIEELVRQVLQVERSVPQLHPHKDQASLEQSLGDPATARAYFAALFAHLAAPRPNSRLFDQLASAAAALPQAGPLGLGWELCTLLPFVARPDQHLVLHPRTTGDAANRLGFALSCDGRPAWRDYSALLRCTEPLRAALEPLGARDQIDVECFMHVVTAKRARA